MHGSFAAVTLAVTILFAAFGTILQVELPPESAPAAAATAPARPDAWSPALLRLAERTERGLGQLAGLPRAH